MISTHVIYWGGFIAVDRHRRAGWLGFVLHVCGARSVSDFNGLGYLFVDSFIPPL